MRNSARARAKGGREISAPFLRPISDMNKGDVLHLDDTINLQNAPPMKVRELLEEKHPPNQPAHRETLIQSEAPPPVHPIIFEALNASTIRTAALHTQGSAGPSGLDAYCWRRLCTAFKQASNDRCHSLSKVAIRICTSFVDPNSISPLLSCRLIAINKYPGIRPIRICEPARRIIAKAVLFLVGGDVIEAAGSVQVCAGQPSGTEAAIHTVRQAFQKEDVEGVLMVDASNAFNALNRHSALQNIQRICSPIATILINTCRNPSELFVDGNIVWFREGTTQGDPLAMPMYALATIPLINRLNSDALQIWYAYDAAAVGKISSLHEWWNKLSSLGPSYGYFANASKTWLITKKEHLEAAQSYFSDTGVNITTDGRPYLGAAIGTDEYTNSFVLSKVQQWCSELKALVNIAATQSHAAYAAYTHGLRCRWSYLMRTTPHISHHLLPLETIIQTELLPMLIGVAPPGDLIRDILALPARFGGISVPNPSKTSHKEYASSLLISEPLRDLILSKNPSYPIDAITKNARLKKETHRLNRSTILSEAADLKGKLNDTLQRAMELASEKGASSWLTALPLAEFGFSLHKGAFRDAVALRYGWLPPQFACLCDCGSNLQPITGETPSSSTANMQDGAHLDIAASGLWGGQFQRTFVDVHVFNMPPETVDASSPPVIENTKIQKSGHMSDAYARSNTLHSPPWPSLPLGGWQGRLPLFTRGLHPF